MLKILQARLQQYVTMNFQMFKLVLEKAEEPEIKLPTSAGLWKKQESSRKTSISALLTIYTKAFDCVEHNKLWKILKEMGIPDHLTCLLRNLYAGQEATVRTGHGTTDWFQIGKEVHQGCILSPCLFNLYAEYIMRNAGLEEVQAGIKIARRTSISALLTMPRPLTVWITTNGGKFLKEMGIPDHLTCLLRNLYAGQEATVRTGHGTTDWK